MENVKIIKRLGGGSEGEAHVAEHKDYGLIVIKRNRTPKRNWSNEANILGTVLDKDRYHYVSHLYEIDLKDGMLTLMLKYCDRGDLEHYLKDRKNVLDGCARTKMVRQVQLQLGAALVFLHTGAMYLCKTKTMSRGPQPGWNPVIHRDIKPANIFLSSHQGHALPDIILGDFGMAITLRPYHSAIKASPKNIEKPETVYGYTDPRFAPPEYRALNNHHGMGVPRSLTPHPSYDIWQFGAVLLFMTARGRLATKPGPMRIGAKYDGTGLREEIFSMLNANPHSRPTDETIAGRLAHWQKCRDQAIARNTAAGDEHMGLASVPPRRAGSSTVAGSSQTRLSGMLTCPKCSFVNNPPRLICHVCGGSLR